MVVYWRYQFWIDFALVALATGLLITGLFGEFKISLNASQVVAACRIWVAPVLTLLGLVCATTAFLFSAIDRSEFKLLRDIGVESQLWSVFSEIIFWLAVAAISSASISFAEPNQFSNLLMAYATFLFGMVALCLLKFAWVMRHIIGVKIRSAQPK